MSLVVVKQLVQAGAVLSIEGTRDGRLAFSGGREGRILTHDLR